MDMPAQIANCGSGGQHDPQQPFFLQCPCTKDDRFTYLDQYKLQPVAIQVLETIHLRAGALQTKRLLWIVLASIATIGDLRWHVHDRHKVHLSRVDKPLL
eukprot:9133019-Pyramimonas_sp.AAC.1